MKFETISMITTILATTSPAELADLGRTLDYWIAIATVAFAMIALVGFCILLIYFTWSVIFDTPKDS